MGRPIINIKMGMPGETFAGKTIRGYTDGFMAGQGGGHYVELEFTDGTKGTILISYAGEGPDESVNEDTSHPTEDRGSLSKGSSKNLVTELHGHLPPSGWEYKIESYSAPDGGKTYIASVWNPTSNQPERSMQVGTLDAAAHAIRGMLPTPPPMI